MRGKHLNSGIRGGLWEEEHLLRMGPAVWLFGWLVHRQTRERDGIGLVLAGSPLTYEIIRQDTGIAVRTLKRWMARLGRSGYIQVTHVARKRMVIQIAKAKKFGPQQLRFPQNGHSFPQSPFFAPNSKGPLLAPYRSSKGPLVASLSRASSAQPAVDPITYGQRAPLYREKQPERQKTKAPISRIFNSADDTSAAALPAETLLPTRQNSPSQVSLQEFSGLVENAVQRCHWNTIADRKYRREADLQAELRVGLGPEVRRDSG